MLTETIISSIIVPLTTAAISAAATLYVGKKDKEKVKQNAEYQVKKAQESEQFVRNTFGSREHVERFSPLDERVNLGIGIKEIRIANFTSNALLNVELVDAVGLSSRSAMVQRIQDLVTQEDIRLTMVITAPDSEAAKEAIRSRKVININTTDEDRERLFCCAYWAIRNNIMPGGPFHKSFTEGNFMYRVTDVSLPYGIFQVIYEDKSKNHIKLDLYSPYITREKERRSIFIYEEKNPEDYKYFSEDFDKIFINAISPAEEKKQEKSWIEKAEYYYGKR